VNALLLRLALLGVPRHLRESVLGDLLEQRAGPAAALAGALAIALHFQAEPYRERAARSRVLLLAVAGGGLLWIVPMAAQALLAQAFVFTDAFSRAALGAWAAPHAVAAVACGLLVGGTSLMPAHADAARAHIVMLLVPLAAVLAGGVLHSLLAAALLPTAAGLAHHRWRGAAAKA
jgi:hypothetical protein